MSYKIVCGWCSKSFDSRWSHTRTCSPKCRKERYAKITGREASKNHGLPTGTVGAISELLVTSYLLSKGYAVFHASSPSCFCDLVAIKNGITYFLEVRTGYKNFNGSYCFPHNTYKNQGEPNLFAVVDRNSNEIVFFDIKNTKEQIYVI